ncbi:MAG: methylmalonyl-CoA mutase [Salinarimonadaceae bacterium]|nr:MAG: methylmalonyl-CoA mutase [Salinarimonadaceae bacterium]
MTHATIDADFPAASREDWMRLVEGVLKGADFEKKLVSRTADGLRIEPLYDKADPAPQPGRAEIAPWGVCQRVDHPDPGEANALALDDLEGGADWLAIVTPQARAARGFGLRIGSLGDLDRALDGVLLDLIGLRLDAGPAGRQAAALLLAHARRKDVAISQLKADLGLDPIGSAACAGGFSAPWETVAARCAQTARALADTGFAGTTFMADGRPLHEAGGSEAQELAGVLASGVAYLRALEAGGVSLDEARRSLAFLLVADADQFMTIAKLRALRRLWARVEDASGLTPEPIRLHAETAWRMTSRRDPWVNMLRGTIAAFSAGLGGADCVTVTPFTAALGLPDGFARRVARNTQHILLQESNLWRVADPAAGAGGYEALTQGLCEEAWTIFQGIEAEGGIVAALGSGSLARRVAATRAARAKAIASRRAPITGVSEFPHLGEAPVDVAMAAPPAPWNPAPAPAIDDFARMVEEAESLAVFAAPPSPAFEPLPETRDAAPFEAMRDRSDAALAASGSRPRVFLANLGGLARFNARASFARNAFAAGGIEAVGEEGFEDDAALAVAFTASGARLACICSDDEAYAERAASAALALKGAGCRRVCLAGRPGDLETALREAGVDAFLSAGCDLAAFLGDVWASLDADSSRA